jgi:hypothetical protein
MELNVFSPNRDVLEFGVEMSGGLEFFFDQLRATSNSHIFSRIQSRKKGRKHIQEGRKDIKEGDQ